jgi:hypothetical protein
MVRTLSLHGRDWSSILHMDNLVINSPYILMSSLETNMWNCDGIEFGCTFTSDFFDEAVKHEATCPHALRVHRKFDAEVQTDAAKDIQRVYRGKRARGVAGKFRTQKAANRRRRGRKRERKRRTRAAKIIQRNWVPRWSARRWRSYKDRRDAAEARVPYRRNEPYAASSRRKEFQGDLGKFLRRQGIPAPPETRRAAPPVIPTSILGQESRSDFNNGPPPALESARLFGGQRMRRKRRRTRRKSIRRRKRRCRRKTGTKQRRRTRR